MLDVPSFEKKIAGSFTIYDARARIVEISANPLNSKAGQMFGTLWTSKCFDLIEFIN
jgi:hypothetical protein